jgi:SOS response regulatory protein OraA/RecX
MTELEQMRRDFAGLAMENLELRTKLDRAEAEVVVLAEALAKCEEQEQLDDAD